MSFRNKLEQKAIRRDERATRKMHARLRMPFCGVVVTKGMVLGHRYLAQRGLDFSLSVGSVHIG